MGKKKKQKGTPKKKQQVPQKLEGPNVLLTGLAAAGVILTAYLVLTGWIGEPPILCDEGSSCDIVQQSRWGTFMGIPTALLGFLTYAALGYIGFRVRDVGMHWKWAWAVSMVGLGYSIYLIAISFLVIEAACFYCLLSFAIMTVIFGVLSFQRPQNLPKLNITAWARQTVIITALIVGAMHLYYSAAHDPAAGPEDPFLRGLAEHLTSEKALLYGAFW